MSKNFLRSGYLTISYRTLPTYKRSRHKRQNFVFFIPKTGTGFPVVEVNGFEPMTPCVQGRCSSQLSYTPGIL